jgi:hypothetical protein
MDLRHDVVTDKNTNVIAVGAVTTVIRMTVPKIKPLEKLETTSG